MPHFLKVGGQKMNEIELKIIRILLQNNHDLPERIHAGNRLISQVKGMAL